MHVVEATLIAIAVIANIPVIGYVRHLLDRNQAPAVGQVWGTLFGGVVMVVQKVNADTVEVSVPAVGMETIDVSKDEWPAMIRRQKSYIFDPLVGRVYRTVRRKILALVPAKPFVMPKI